MERIIDFRPGWDRTTDIHCMDICFVLKGEYGAVQFLMSTGWYPGTATERLLSTDGESGQVVSMWRTMFQPRGVDLGYHSKTPMYEGHDAIGSIEYDYDDREDLGTEDNPLTFPKAKPTGTFDPCPYTDGGPCYYDGSSLNAQPIFRRFLTEGDKVIWEKLEEYYVDRFGELK